MAIRIFIDQGHNPSGPNGGAVSGNLSEADINFVVGSYLADLLAQDPRFEVRVSRETSETVLGTSNASSLAARVNAANAWPADYFISIHCNASTNPSLNGTEVYVYQQQSEAYQLAQQVLLGIVQRVGTRNNGVRLNPGLYVLRRTQMPAILVELGYITNPSDAQKLSDDPYGFAQGIYNGLLHYFAFSPLG